jgi:hypothetical protein
MKFCESCGAKIEALPVCPQCGAPLVPAVKFCESCGAPVGPAASAAAMIPAAAAPVGASVSPAPVTSPVQEVKPMAEPLVKMEEKTVMGSGEKPAPAPVPVKSSPKTEAVRAPPKETGPKKPLPKKTAILAGIVVLVLLGAAAYFVALPMLSGTVSPQPAINTPALPGSPSATAGPAGTLSSAQFAAPTTAQASIVTEPTQIPPANLLVTFQADRDPITGIVTITFTGGAGRNGVKNVDIRLTRSDGQVISKTVTLTDIGQGLTMQGTKTGDDRIELTANYNNGEHYKIIDKILEYTRRNW